MIKVIKHGKMKQTTCSDCGCVFTYEKEDTFTEQIDINEWYTFITCPDCGSKIFTSFKC